MALHEKAPNIIPVIANILTRHPDAIPITRSDDVGIYDYYAMQFTAIEAAPDESTEPFADSLRTIGRTVTRIVEGVSATEESRVILSLLNESVARMPLLSHPLLEPSEKVREMGNVNIDLSSLFTPNETTFPVDVNSYASRHLEVAATILDDGRTVVNHFLAGEIVNVADDRGDFSCSRQHRAIGKLGLTDIFHANMVYEKPLLSGRISSTMLTQEQTVQFGDYLQRFFAGLEDA